MPLNVMKATKGDTLEVNWYIQIFVKETKIILADFFFVNKSNYCGWANFMGCLFFFFLVFDFRSKFFNNLKKITIVMSGY